MSRRFRAPTDLAIVDAVELGSDEAVVYLAPLPDGPISCLEGPAAIIWEEALSGPEESLAERVAVRAGVEVDEVRHAVTNFVAELVERGLLER